MSLTVSVPSLLAYTGAMTLLAAMPSLSVLTVTARAASSGFVQGVWVSVGVVAGDLLFIVVALTGLSLLVTGLGGLFALVPLAGGVYLLWLAWRLLAGGSRRTASPPSPPGAQARGSFMSGLLLTLADQKAVLFYLGFFPAFFTVPALGVADVLLIAAITPVAVGGVKIVYAALAARGGRALDAGTAVWLHRIAGVMLGAVGVVLVARALHLVAS